MHERQVNNMGRKSKLTPELQEDIVKALRAGNYIEAACAFAGIDQATFQRWMNRGEKEATGEYCAFCKLVKKARADAEVRNVAIIQNAAPANWTAAAWWLERSFPNRWGRQKQVIEHVGKDDGPIDVVDSARDLLMQRLNHVASRLESEPDEAP